MAKFRAGFIGRPFVCGLLVLVVAACAGPLSRTQTVQAAGEAPNRTAPNLPPLQPVAQIAESPLRLNDERPVRVGEGERSDLRVWLDIVVDPNGVVRSVRGNAEPRLQDDTSKTSAQFAPAVAAAEQEALTWRYSPTLRNGQPVAAYFREVVEINPAVRNPRRRVPFPEIRGDSKVEIILIRSGCYGWCPTYKVLIDGGGSVVFDGIENVQSSGHRSVAIGRTNVERLIKKFRETDFFSLDDDYISPVTDIPRYSVFIQIGDAQKRVIYDDHSASVGMPDVIVSLGNAIDAIAGTASWIRETDTTLSSLKARGLKPTSLTGGVILGDAIRRQQWELAEALIDAGAPLNEAVGVAAYSRCTDAIRTKIVEAAISRGTKRDRTQALTIASRLGDIAFMRQLLARGADPNGSASEGEAPLFGVYSAGAAQLLVAVGADAAARNSYGWTTLMRAGSEDAALYLLDIGVDPTVKDRDGETIADRARKLGWTHLLAKLS